jgi:chemotaxis protein MotB
MAENSSNIIVKKVHKSEHNHHGGAWKLAYADFVTAMMAFFLLMWLLGSTSKEVREGIADYFKNPWKPSVMGGSGSGESNSILKGGGEDLAKSVGQVKLTNQGSRDAPTDAGEDEAERQQLTALKEKIETMIEINPVLSQFKDQLLIDITNEGLRVQIIDKEKRPMFSLASARMEPYASQILSEIAPVMNELPNKISILGHTDARPFPGDGKNYSNWELSADRANAARKELIRAGLREEKMMRVIGLASSVPLNRNDPIDPINRRMSIIVMNKKTEDEIVNNVASANANAVHATETTARSGPPSDLPARKTPRTP